MESHGTLFVVDDDPPTRELLEGLVAAVGIQVEGFASAEEFLDRSLYDLGLPCCLLLELRLPGLSGIGLQQKLNQDGIKIPLIFLTRFGDIPTTVRAIQSGAVNFMEKPPHNATLMAEISRAMDISTRDSAETSQKKLIRSRVSQLSACERKVLALLLNGKNNKEIATVLGIGVPTVTKHRSKVFRKLEVHDIVQLVRLTAACS